MDILWHPSLWHTNALCLFATICLPLPILEWHYLWMIPYMVTNFHDFVMPGLPNLNFCVCRVARQRYRSRHCWRTHGEDSEPTVAHHLRFPGKHARFKITETIWIPDSQNPDLESPYYFGKLEIMVRFNPLVLDQIFINYLKTKPVSLGHLTIRQLSTKLY